MYPFQENLKEVNTPENTCIVDVTCILKEEKILVTKSAILSSLLMFDLFGNVGSKTGDDENFLVLYV